MKNILIEQNLHWAGNTQTFVHRDKLDKLISYLPLRQIITITGVRRCGKSTLAKLAINHLIETGVNPQNIVYVNLEQPSFLEVRHDPGYLQVIYDTYLQLADPQGKTYVIFDEIQFFENWQVFIKSQYESSDIKFIVTGSNSSMLSNELNTILSGRSLNIHLDTFSFTEFLTFKGISYATEIDRVSNRIAIKRAQDEYLQWGGFYEVFTVADPVIKKDILISYAKNILYQDIVPRYGIRNAEAIERLFFYLLANVTGVLNYTTLAGTFGINKKTVEEYIRYFEDVFLLQRIDKFHNKPKERIKSSKKVYVQDNGFLQIAAKHSEDLGKSLENAVFIKLNQECEQLSYLKDTYEVDFYTGEVLYQVAYEISNEKTLRRELRSFGQFPQSENTPCRLITYDDKRMAERAEILPLSEFFLQF
uniref:ATPase n=1 Tax=uncultured Thiotrichaceae bacterium TaxID=298394 RepID=A0A6S6TXU1_9GAMM|nr:MAG: ATPase [uncultured Thiotrichaceae bacterium]